MPGSAIFGSYLGLFYMFMSAVCFSTMSMLVALLARSKRATCFLSLSWCFRASMSYLCVHLCQAQKFGIVSKDRQTRILLRKKHGGYHRNAMQLDDCVEIPISDATVIIFTAPFGTSAMAFCFLREHFGKLDGLALTFGFVGLILVSGPFSGFEEKRRRKILRMEFLEALQ